jgi:hypothetical protein
MAAGDLRVIPTTNAPFYTETVPLDGINYRLYFGYNQRENCWYLSIADELGKDLLNGIKLVCGLEYLLRWRYIAGLPPGQLFMIYPLTDSSPPGLNDLAPGGRCQLTYITTT